MGKNQDNALAESIKPDPVPTLWDDFESAPRFPAELPEAKFDRDRGTGQALSSPIVDAWRARAIGVIERLAASGRPFTVDAVVEESGLPKGEVGTNLNNAIGALFLHAVKAGLIERTGRRVPTERRSNHGRHVAEWVGTGYGSVVSDLKAFGINARMMGQAVRAMSATADSDQVEAIRQSATEMFRFAVGILSDIDQGRYDLRRAIGDLDAMEMSPFGIAGALDQFIASEPLPDGATTTQKVTGDASY